ncbi:MAG: hypothetical protein LUO93_11400, partial [Methanomicrobiales archaeon]|nr:hypothetical protein [Methanomicrobiales archaeon]
RRNLVETTFSVLKRSYGENVQSRKYRNQVKEIKVRVVLYNLNRWIQIIWFIVIRGILRSQDNPSFLIVSSPTLSDKCQKEREYSHLDES